MRKKYQEIYDKLRQEITTGLYEYGEKLPSEAQMMETYSVSRQTVRRTLSLLKDAGLIQKSRGSGSFVNYSQVSLNTKRIAVIVNDINDSVFPSLMQQIDSALFHRGYSVSFYSTGSNALKERDVLKQCVNIPVDGVIMLASTLTPMCVNLDLIHEVKQAGTKFLFFDSWYANTELTDIPLVCIENFAGGQKITEHLIQQCHSHIGGFYWKNPMSMIARFSGIVNAMIRYYGKFDNSLFFEVANLEDADIISSSPAVEILHSLDAFICPAGALVHPLIKALQLHGSGALRTIVIFDEVSVPQIDGVEYIILQHATRELAQLCVDKLLDLINGLEVSSIQVPWRLSKTSSVQNPPSSFPVST